MSINVEDTNTNYEYVPNMYSTIILHVDSRESSNLNFKNQQEREGGEEFKTYPIIGIKIMKFLYPFLHFFLASNHNYSKFWWLLACLPLIGLIA